jgi:secreted trypsin-like serine protease
MTADSLLRVAFAVGHLLLSFSVAPLQAQDTGSALVWNTTASIVSGRPARQGAYPWYAIPAGNFLCGATLIHPDILLTAAHCDDFRISFVRPSLFRRKAEVLLGGNQRDGSDALERIEVDIQRLHPQHRLLSYDFMLVKLKRPSKAPLVPWNTNETSPIDGEPLTILGYGSTRVGGKSFDTLLEGQVNAVNYDTCKNDYDTEGSQPLDSSMMCAAKNGTDSCQGDSGGPLLNANGTLVGLISLGECENPLPGLYARVSEADQFIRDGICELSDLPPAYCNGRKASGVCNTCAGRWIRIGTQMHRKVFGVCFEICSTVTPSFWRFMGYKCGPCA